jgi:hypothetical protein
MSFTGFHPLWDKILSQKLQAVADQGCHLEGSSLYKGTAYEGVYCIGKIRCVPAPQAGPSSKTFRRTPCIKHKLP